MFAIQIPYFDLIGSCEANPCCYWRKIAPETVMIIDDGMAVLVNQKKENICFSCSFEEFCNKWYLYFDIETDYCFLHDRFALALKDEAKLLRDLQVRRGVRLFKIEWFEGLLKSLLLAVSADKAQKAFELLIMQYGKTSELRLYQRPSVRFKSFPSPAALCACVHPTSIEQAVSEVFSEQEAVAFALFVNSAFIGDFEQENIGDSVADFVQYCSDFEFSKYLSFEQLRKFAIYVWRYCVGDKSCYIGSDFSKCTYFNNFAYFAEWYGDKLKDIAGFVEFVTKAG